MARGVGGIWGQGSVLAGVRVLDFSGGMAGPLATMLLAEAGADVVKVEPPEGDVLRGTPGFLTYNRSKRGLLLDLRTAPGQRQLAGLLPGADVLVHGFRPDAEARFGLDPKDLARAAPRLIVGRIRGYPAGHPDEGRSGWDPLVLARLGLLDEQAGQRPGPVYLRLPLASLCASYLLAIGVLARLYHRLRTGRGGVVTTSLAQGALVPMTMHWARAERPSAALAQAMPKDRPVTLFECGDGNWIHVMKAPDTAPLMRQALDEMGPAGVAAANATTRAHPLCPNQGANAAAFRRRPAGEWLEDLWAHDIAAQRVMPLGTLFGDEQARANGYVVTLTDPRAGRIEGAGSPLHLSPPCRVRGPAPALGEHTAEVVAELSGAACAAADAPAGSPAEPPAPLAGTPPLDGLRVLDLGQHVAGPFAPMLLADLGADVIKVEPPAGDAMRWNEAAFEGSQRGKRSVCLDLRDPKDRPALEALVHRADVVHHNIRMASAQRRGVDGPTLRGLNPRLVFCHVSAYGPLGPRAGWPGFDQLFQATSGWEREAAGPGNPPMWHRFGMMDHLGAMASVVATLLALVHRERTGQGQDVAASLLGAAVLATGHTYRRADGTVAPVPALDAGQTGVHPACRLYQSQDGWLAVADCRAGGTERLVAAAGARDAADLEDAFAALRTADALAVLAARGVPAEAVRLRQREPFLDSEANRRCRLTVAYPHPTYGRIEQIGAFWDFGDLPLRLDRSAPARGQHTAEVLADLGVTPSRQS